MTGGTGLGAGIHTVAAAGGTVDVASGVIINGSASGIAIRDGDANSDGTDETGGNVVVTSAGALTGDAILGLGDDVYNLTGGSQAGFVWGDDAVASANDGNDTFNWSGGTLTGGFHGQNGSDTALVTTANYNGTQLLDGGDDVSIADGWIDSLTLNGLTVSANGTNLINWEALTVNGGQLTILDGAITVGSDPGYGMFLTGATSLEALDALAITGNLDIGTGSTFIGTGGGAGVYSVSGNVGNAGIIDLQDGTVGDVFSVSGNYTGSGGTLALDTYLGTDGSASDRLVVAGDTSGTTLLTVTNAGGPGAQTLSDGIKVIQVDGASNGTFQLTGDYVIGGQQAVVGGAFAYTLWKNGVVDPADGDWYLRSQLQPVDPDVPVPPAGPLYQPGVPLYESYPQALLALNGLPTLQQRVGNRHWNEPAVPAKTVFCKDSSQNYRCAVTPEQADYYAGSQGKVLIEQSAFWSRVEGTHTEIESDRSTSSTDYSQSIWKLQAGLDGEVMENNSGKLIAGINGQYGRVTQDITSFYGTGQISTEGYGIGGTLTWYGYNGFYVDAQASATWYGSDLDSDWIGQLTDGNHGFGYAFSTEAGKRFDMGGKWTLTPQMQLAYSNVDFDAFTDPYGATVSLDSADSLLGRLGLAAEYKDTWTSSSGDIRRLAAYGIGNLYYEFLDGTQVDVSQTAFVSKKDALWGGIGLGGSYNWGDDKFSLYGEALVASSLENVGDSYSYGGTVGFRMKW
ncbi:autotransporter outer membrane beta-barrel domain-containing protein [Mesorhizobium sp. M0152]|uniref:autotransporter family protein n=1 Tax=Mesorhizobium sp. M0152 TaxID=2956898 RepID=UPI003337554C